jgi:hypothetical protein
MVPDHLVSLIKAVLKRSGLIPDMQQKKVEPWTKGPNSKLGTEFQIFFKKYSWNSIPRDHQVIAQGVKISYRSVRLLPFWREKPPARE